MNDRPKLEYTRTHRIPLSDDREAYLRIEPAVIHFEGFLTLGQVCHRCVCACARTHTLSHTHTHTHTHTYTQEHPHTHENTHTHIREYTHTRTRAYQCTHTARTHTRRTHARTQMHMHTPTHLHTDWHTSNHKRRKVDESFADDESKCIVYHTSLLFDYIQSLRQD